jgi:TPR repeat protein
VIRQQGKYTWNAAGKLFAADVVMHTTYAHHFHSISGASCPFCRAPKPEKNENLKWLEMRIKANDANAFFSLGMAYLYGDEEKEVEQDTEKALQLLLRGGELGDAKSYCSIAFILGRTWCRKG